MPVIIGKLYKEVQSLEEMNHIARHLASLLKKGDILVFSGDLGAGKTTLIQMICRTLGIEEDVTSPTFTILQEYSDPQQTVKIYHFDFYRLRDWSELKAINFDDYLHGDGICLMEWGEKVEELLPIPHYHITITIKNDQTRVILLEQHGA